MFLKPLPALLINLKLIALSYFVLPKNLCGKVNFLKVSKGSHFLLSSHTNSPFGLFLDIKVKFKKLKFAALVKIRKRF